MGLYVTLLHNLYPILNVYTDTIPVRQWKTACKHDGVLFYPRLNLFPRLAFPMLLLLLGPEKGGKWVVKQIQLPGIYLIQRDI